MGVKDSKAKEYISDNARFSDLCNYVLFDGNKVINPNSLVEKDTTQVLSVFGIDKKQLVLQKWRDILKNVTIKYADDMYLVLIGIENQTDVHYAMPVKAMIYDALSYGQQINDAKRSHEKEKDYGSSAEFLSGFTKKDKLVPVITITVYMGTDNWDGPRSLYEMMGNIDKNILQNASDKNKMESVLKKDPAFKKIDRETAAAINLFAGMNLKVNEKDEVVDVCKAWEEQKKSGQIEERIDIISKFLENGGTKEEAKRMLEVSEEDIIMAEKRISEIHQTICV